MYENPEETADNYSPFLSRDTQRRASAPAFEENDSQYDAPTVANYGTSSNPLHISEAQGRNASTSNGRNGYDSRMPIIRDAILVPGSSTSPGRYRTQQRPPADTTKQHRACFIPLVVLLCIGVFVLEMRQNNWKFEAFNHNPMFGPSAGTLIKCGAKLDCLIEGPSHEYYRIFSPMWLHAGVIHIVCNMAATWQLGMPLEREYGWKTIAPLYMAAGIAGTLCSILFLPNSIMVGASGAVFGLLGACWAEWIMNIDHRRTCKVFLSLFIITALNLALGVTPLLDNFAHTGGLLAGIIWGLFLLRNEGESCGGFLSLFVAMVVTTAVFVAVIAQVHLDQTCTWCSFINCVPSPWWNCNIDQFFGPCSVKWLPQDQLLNVTCAEGLPHFIDNVTSEPTQAIINEECSKICSDICWTG